jgi:FKBP-type peptidyl-prolyl cis-trans isomerase FkpA
MTRLFSVCALAMIIGLTACDKFKVTTTATGEKIQIHEKGKSGKVGKDGDVINFDLIIQTSKDSTIKNSFKEGTSYTIPLQKGAFKGSFENALYNIAEGDSTTVFVPADSLFKQMGQPNPPGIAKGSDLKFTVKMHKIITRAAFDKELLDKKNNEPKIVEEYAAKALKNVLKTPEGINYSVIEEGTGAMPANGQTVIVKYVGKFMDGKIFDQSKPESPTFSFKIGDGGVIPGWDKALLTMKKGGKSTFVIPSVMAYGEQGGGPIPPNTPLVFDITLVEIK